PRHGVVHSEAIAGETSRWFNQLRPRDFAGAVFLQRHLHATHGAGDTRSAIADERTTFTLDEVAVLVEINIAVRGGGGHFAIIDRGRAAVFETNHHETATAEVPRRGMRHCEYKRNRDRSIDGVATTLHDFDADLRRELVGR